MLMMVDCGQLSCVLMKIIIHEIFIPHAPRQHDDEDHDDHDDDEYNQIYFLSKSYSLGYRIEFNYSRSEGELNLNIYMTLNKDLDI